MKTDGTFTKWMRLVLAATMAIAVGLAIVPGTSTPVAQAAGTIPETAFEIDGNRIGIADWAALYGAGATPGGLPTTGVTSTYGIQPDGCLAGEDVTLAGPPNQKVASGPNWTTTGNLSNGKANLESVEIAAEKVNTGGQIVDMLYIGYTSCDGGTGSFITWLHVPNPTGPDFIIIVELSGSAQDADAALVYRGEFNTGWSQIAVDAGDVDRDLDAEFGEVALNLTSLGIVPADSCQTLELGGLGTGTLSGLGGVQQNSLPTSNIQDIAAVPPLTISNCGALDVEKTTVPDVETSPIFAYEVTQDDGGVVHDATLTQQFGEPVAPFTAINAAIGGRDVHNWENVISAPDYLLDETVVPSGWAIGKIECTYYDIFPVLDGSTVVAPPGERTALLHDGAGLTGDLFLIPPFNVGDTPIDPASCEIVNETAGIRVVKTGQGDTTQDFAFDATNQTTTNLRIADDTETDVDETTWAFAVDPDGGNITITETIPDTTPGWKLESIVCTTDSDQGGSPVVVEPDLDAGTVTVAPEGGATITCIYTNNQQGRLIVEKQGAPEGSTFDFTHDVAGSAIPSPFSLTVPAEGVDSVDFGDVTPDEYTITELLFDVNDGDLVPDVVGGAVCSGETAVGPTTGNVVATANVGFGETVTCTFNNVQNGRIVVEKTSINGSDDFEFEIDDQSIGSITTDVNGIGTDTLSRDVAPGQYRLDEVINPRYELTGIVCRTDGGDLDGDTVVDTGDDATGALVDVSAGETVTCSFENTRKEATFTIEKTWGPLTPNAVTVVLDAFTTGDGPNDELDPTVEATSSLEQSVYTPNGEAARQITVYSGQTINFSEAFKVEGQGDGFETVPTCREDETNDVVIPDNGSVPEDRRSGEITVGNDPVDITCVFDNIPERSGVRLVKVWRDADTNLPDALDGETADLTITTPRESVSNPNPSVAPELPNADNWAEAAIVAGDVVTFTEDVSNQENYETSFDCRAAADQANWPVNDPVEDTTAAQPTWTLLIDAADVAGDGKSIVCRFVNDRIDLPLTVSKDWSNGRVGDTVLVTVNDGENVDDIVSFEAVANGDENQTSITDPGAPVTVYAGQTLTLQEAFQDNAVLNPVEASDPLAYDSQLVCETTLSEGGPNISVTQLSEDGVVLVDSVDLPVVPEATGIDCTFFNVRRSFDVRVRKFVRPITDDGVFDVLINGVEPPALAAASNEDPPNRASELVSVFVGDTVTFSERATVNTGTDLANYRTTFSCDNGVAPEFDPNTLVGSFVMPATFENPPGELDPNAIVVCSYTNTRRSAELIVEKSWADSPENGDTVSLVIDGGDVTQDILNPGSDSNDGVDNDDDARATVFAGEAITVEEIFQDSALPANYDVSLECVDNFDTVLVGADASSPGVARQQLDGSFDVPSAPAGAGAWTITCTFTNDRLENTLTYVKRWTAADLADDTLLTMQRNPAGGVADPASVTATALSTPAASGNGPSSETLTATVYAGEQITLGETLGADNVGTYGVAGLTCTAGTPGSLSEDPISRTFTFSPSDVSSAISCEVINERVSSQVFVMKDWEDPAGGPAVVDITATVTDATTGGSETTSSTSPTDAMTAALTAASGELVTVDEVFDLTEPNLGREHYDTTLLCTDLSGNEYVNVDVFADGVPLSATFTAPDTQEDITCEFTNTRKSTTLVLQKDWQAEVAGNQVDLSIETDTDDPTTAVANGDGSVSEETASITAYSGESYLLTEVIDEAGNDPVVYDPESLTCVDASENPVTNPVAGFTGDNAGATGNILIDPADTGEGTEVRCTFLNRALRGNITIVKNIDGDDGTFRFDGTWLDADATDGFNIDIPTTDGTGQAVYTDVLIGEYTVTEENLAPAFGTEVSCVGTDDTTLSGPADLTPGLQGNIGLDDGETVVCTFNNTENSTITIVKDAVPDFDQDFGFSQDIDATGDFTLRDDGVDAAATTKTFSNVVPNQTYTVTELLPVEGWVLDSIECVTTEGSETIWTPVVDQETDALTGALTIELASADNVICTFTNDANESDVEVLKTVAGTASDAPPWSFDFTITGEDGAPVPTPVGGVTTIADAGEQDPSANTVVWTGLEPGREYTVAEVVPNDGYTEGALVCVGGDEENGDLDGDPTDASYTFLAPLGDLNDPTVTAEVSCTITNTAIPSAVQVTKTVEGIDDTFPWAFEFSITPEDGIAAPTPVAGQESPASGPGDGTLTDTVAWMGLVPGAEYTIAETPLAGWTEGVLTCSNAAGPLTDLDGVADTSFTFEAPLGDPQTAYEITCAITNVADPSTVTVQKSVGGVGENVTWAFEFDITPDANLVSENTIATGQGTETSTDTVTWNQLVPGGTYTVSEVIPAEGIPGYEAQAMVCTGGIEPDGDDLDGDPTDASYTFIAPLGGTAPEVSCTMTNLGDAPTLVITKTTIGDVGTFDFTVTPTEGDPSSVSVTTATAGVPVSSAPQTLVSGVGYTVTEDDPGTGWSPGTVLCYVTPADSEVRGEYDGGATAPGDRVECEVTNIRRGDLTVEKTEVGPVTRDGTTYTVQYTVNVRNESFTAEGFTLVENPGPAANVTITSVNVTGPQIDGGSIDLPVVDGVVTDGTVVDGTIAARLGIDPAGPGLVYTVTVTFTMEPSSVNQDCSQEGAGNGAFNSATVTFDPADSDGSNSDDACVELPKPDIDVEKTGINGPAVLIDSATNRYEATYTVTVTNIGDGPGSYSLEDKPDLADGATNVEIEIVGDPVFPVTIAGGTPEVPTTDTYTVKVRFDVDGSMTTDERTCATEDTPDRGAFNLVEITLGDGSTDTATGCVDIPEPQISRTKTSDSIVRSGPDQFTVTYTLTVTNAAGGGPAVYDLADDITVGTGVTISDVQVPVAPAGVTPTITATGITADDVAIAAGETVHTYQVVVVVDVDVTEQPDGVCDPETDGGISNSLTIDVRGDQGEPVSVCDEFSTLTLVKETPNDDGADLGPEAFTLIARQGDDVIIEGPGPLQAAAVLPGEYELDETPRLDGYEIIGFTCGDAEMEGQTVLVEPGANVECLIVNDDLPVDLELTKNDDGITVIAGGAPFEYTITVQNIGDRDVDLDEDVTVTDELPAPLRWVSFPDTCEQAGQVLTCDIDPALLPAGGDPVVITATVRAPADAPSGTYTNRASVTTEDDPSTDEECPALEDNNVDCEDTPVDRRGAVQITKTDNVANGASVQPGDTFTYALVVKNTGVSTLLPGLNVTDDLPAELEFVSAAGGAGWTCNDSDPIDCTYAPSLAPGATAPTITVTVLVAEDASAELIENVAVVRAAVDRDCPTATARLTQAFTPACNEVTDDDDETTPLNPNADLAIVKTASVAQLGAPGTFTYTLDITNNGPGTAVDVVIGDVVPSRLTVTGVSSNDFDCSRSGNSVECTIDSLAVGDGGRVTITVSVPATDPGGDITNVGTVESSTPDPDLTNNSDDAVVVIVAQAPPTTTIPVTLPETGSNLTVDMVRAATLLLLIGGAVILITRRRRDEPTTG